MSHESQTVGAGCVLVKEYAVDQEAAPVGITTGSATSYEHGTLDTSSAEAEATETTAATTATNQAATATNQNATATNQNTGGGQAFSLMNPFEVFYIWRRTA